MKKLTVLTASLLFVLFVFASDLNAGWRFHRARSSGVNVSVGSGVNVSVARRGLFGNRVNVRVFNPSFNAVRVRTFHPQFNSHFFAPQPVFHQRAFFHHQPVFFNSGHSFRSFRVRNFGGCY